MAFVELTTTQTGNQSGSFVDSDGNSVQYFLNGTGGQFTHLFDPNDHSYGDIDDSNVHLGGDNTAGNVSPETLDLSFTRGGVATSVSGLQFKINATDSEFSGNTQPAEMMDFIINGVDVNLQTLINSGDVTLILDNGGTDIDANGDLVGASLGSVVSDIYQFNFPITTFVVAHNGTQEGSLVELFADNTAVPPAVVADGTVHGEAMNVGYNDGLGATVGNGDPITNGDDITALERSDMAA